MNIKRPLSLVALFISILSFSIFSSCDKDTRCYLQVHVLDDDTREPIPHAKIEIYQDGGQLYARGNITGETNNEGIYSCSFFAPAILNIAATLDVEFGYRKGENSVRLKEGEVVHVNVTMPQQIY